MATAFEDFVNVELPKRISTEDNPMTTVPGLIPVTTGVGLEVTFTDPRALSGGGNTQSIAKEYSFTKSLVWKIQHNMNTAHYSVTLQDSENVPMFAGIRFISRDEIWVEFTEAEEGTANVIFNM